MSRKQTYLTILAISICVILAGIFMHIQEINTIMQATLAAMKDPKISITAAVCAFIFMGSGKYWFYIIGTALITALVIQYYFLRGGLDPVIIAYRTFAFVVVVYLLNLVKLLFNK
ncbi:MAG: hypothetical protein J6A33_04570 [Alphaproteobacteria bacterium]|nr:hypothetical protein [Alphaproteobacteria bacterium]